MRVVRTASAWLPQGNTLSRAVLLARHRHIVALLWAHVPGLAAFALATGEGTRHALLDVLPIAVLALLASQRPLDRASRAVWATLGLLTSSAVLVHISGGAIEAHFHFFVMLAVVALYQHWVPFLLSVGFVAGHHALLSVVLPTSVFNHPAALAHPVRWALLHAGFVLAAAAVHLVAWRSSEQGSYDTLTGLPGAGLFVRRLEQVLERGPAAVLYVDLDGFKQVNDRFGHLAGDELLASAARRMEATVRGDDFSGRLGGDEFAVIVPGSGEGTAAVVATRLIEELARPFTVAAGTACIGISVGIDLVARGGDAERAIGRADLAMYEAKQAGKGRFVLAPPHAPPQTPALAVALAG